MVSRRGAGNANAQVKAEEEGKAQGRNQPEGELALRGSWLNLRGVLGPQKGGNEPPSHPTRSWGPGPTDLQVPVAQGTHWPRTHASPPCAHWTRYPLLHPTSIHTHTGEPQPDRLPSLSTHGHTHTPKTPRSTHTLGCRQPQIPGTQTHALTHAHRRMGRAGGLGEQKLPLLLPWAPKGFPFTRLYLSKIY